ncbi:MAG: glutamyl-tRNA reductase [Clostridium sp.]|uniref:glutamyl-tRNA reductase n=1 Tax=Clostridium sp. DSM 8431 TaxID=1761781 RepID=UPI0008EEC8B0|nr:glutamyl-tRNA reductase [Clostridium sp. DSM 8431]MCR4943706.1 glutamyl-tRNA reductase [Clostridium sp.]SFU42331.1 glutamyl-tRNA reductase [Clostridium sp. DSM 8431]
MKLGLIGLKRDIDISIREKFAFSGKKKDEKLKALLREFEEAVILSTCNRTEIYVSHDLEDDELLDKVFSILGYDESLKKYVFLREDYYTIKHLFRLSAGFHSKILGEDQILGQIRNAYMDSYDIDGVSKNLGRLFENAIACGKKFRTEAKLYEIPVSSISIVTDMFIHKDLKKIMVLGYGEIGKLAIKYLEKGDFEEIYLVLRDINKAKGIEDNRVKVITFNEKNKVINDMDGIIGATSAPHSIVLEKDIEDEGKKIYCFDMAIPRDFEEAVLRKERIEAYNIDEISKIDDANKKLREERMRENEYLVYEAIEEFQEWLRIRQISNQIKKIKSNGDEIYKRRLESFKHKRQNSEDTKLVETLLKSTSDVYVHRAINLLKEEKLKGSEGECLKIIQKIFAPEEIG